MLLSLRSGVPTRSNSRHRQSMARLLPGWGIIPYPDKEGKAGFSGRRSGSGHRCAGSSFSSVSCAVCAAMQERLSPPAPAGDKANRSPAWALPPCAFRPLRRLRLILLTKPEPSAGGSGFGRRKVRDSSSSCACRSREAFPGLPTRQSSVQPPGTFLVPRVLFVYSGHAKGQADGLVFCM